MDEERRRGRDKSETRVNATQKTKTKRTTKKDSSTDAELCGKCGFRAHPPGRNCPAADTTCHSCKRKGHFKAVYKSLKEEKKDKILTDIGALKVNAAYDKDTLKIILNSGASGHVINSIDGFKEWEEDNALIYTANREVV